jgi:Domain of unknown function (DUF5655)
MGTKPPLWCCPACGREFAHRNQSHACGHHTLEQHFEGREPRVRELFDAFLARLEAIGPVRVLPEKTRIAFQVRMSFAQLTTRRDHLDGHLVLARRADGPPFRKVETISPRNHVHHFRLESAADLLPLEPFLAEAYAVGAQEHLTPRA